MTLMTVFPDSTYTDRHSDSPTAARLFGVASWISLLSVVVLIAFATMAATRVGHWPYYSNPDPKDLRLPILHVAALLSFPLALVSVPVGFFVAILSWSSLPRRHIVVFAIGAAAWAFIFPITGKLFEWLVD